MTTYKYHYVYRITNLKLNKHYYGARSSNLHPANDLGKIYFSTSSDTIFQQDQRNNPTNYKYKIIKIVPTRTRALLLKIKLHSYFNVGVNENFYNKAKQTTAKFDTSGNSELASKVFLTLSKIGNDGLNTYQRKEKARRKTLKKQAKFIKQVPWSTKLYFFETDIFNDHRDVIKPSMCCLYRIFRNIDKKITNEAYRQSDYLKSFGESCIGKTYKNIGFIKERI